MQKHNLHFKICTRYISGTFGVHILRAKRFQETSVLNTLWSWPFNLPHHPPRRGHDISQRHCCFQCCCVTPPFTSSSPQIHRTLNRQSRYDLQKFCDDGKICFGFAIITRSFVKASVPTAFFPLFDIYGASVMIIARVTECACVRACMFHAKHLRQSFTICFVFLYLLIHKPNCQF